MGGRGRGAALFAALGLAALYGCGKATERPAVPSPGPPATEPAPGGPDGGPEPMPASEPATTLTSGEHGPLVLASDPDRLYWGTTEQGTGPVIRVMPKNGGSTATLIAVPRALDLTGGLHHTAWIDALYVDASWVFFSAMEVESVPNPDEVATVHQLSAFYRAPKSGGTAEPFPGLEGFGPPIAPFSPDDDFIYSFQELSAAGIVLAAVPKAGGASRAISLEAPDGKLFQVNSIAMDAHHWYVSRSNYFGAAHAQCVSRAPKSGGVLEDIWCPDFMVQLLLPAPGQLFGVNPWPWTAAPGPWAIDLATGRPGPVALSDKQVTEVAVDPSGASLYAIELAYGSTIPLVPGTWDVVHIDLASRRRTLLDRSEPQQPRRGTRLIVEAGTIFFTRDGEVLRMER